MHTDDFTAHLGLVSPSDDQEEQAFLEDLKAYYDNPQIYSDPRAPQVFKTRTTSDVLPHNPTLISAELNGEVIANNLVEVGLALMFRTSNFENPEQVAVIEGIINNFRSAEDINEWRQSLW